jgi:uncharacterized protein (DUF433 family)
MDWRDHITVDPQIRVGKPIVKGTGISVELVIDLLAAGWTEQQILNSYPTLKSDVRACLAYASDVLQGMEPLRVDEQILADLNHIAAPCKRKRSELIWQAVRQAEGTPCAKLTASSPDSNSMPTTGPPPRTIKREAIRDLAGEFTRAIAK